MVRSPLPTTPSENSLMDSIVLPLSKNVVFVNQIKNHVNSLTSSKRNPSGENRAFDIPI